MEKDQGPVRADQVPAETEKTEEQLRKEAVARAASARVARHRAMRKTAPDEFPPSSENLAGDLERRLRAREERAKATRKAVQAWRGRQQ
jgi:hypothetical protein